MTVRDFFDEEGIDLEDLEERSDESDYWRTCFKFVTENWTILLNHLTEKQERWMDRIRDDMIEYRIKNRSIR